MSLFSKIFGGGKKSDPEPVEYKGFSILPDPITEGDKYRLSARIEKTINGDHKTHLLIRADLVDSRDEAEDISVAKAKQVIDEQGERIFG